MNNVFVFIVMIVAIVTFGRLIEIWMRQRKEQTADGEELEETLARLTQLEERIRVLERIVTENRVDLKQQIDNL